MKKIILLPMLMLLPLPAMAEESKSEEYSPNNMFSAGWSSLAGVGGGVEYMRLFDVADIAQVEDSKLRLKLGAVASISSGGDLASDGTWVSLTRLNLDGLVGLSRKGHFVGGYVGPGQLYATVNNTTINFGGVEYGLRVQYTWEFGESGYGMGVGGSFGGATYFGPTDSLTDSTFRVHWIVAAF